MAAKEKAGIGDSALETFLKELVWREFSYHLLFHWPALPDEPFKPEFASFPWDEDAAKLKAWQRGQTGYPIVDAGMRQLWHTGWMHNRVRMIVASFLIKHLLIPGRPARLGSGIRWWMPIWPPMPRPGSGSRAPAPMPPLTSYFQPCHPG